MKTISSECAKDFINNARCKAGYSSSFPPTKMIRRFCLFSLIAYMRGYSRNMRDFSRTLLLFLFRSVSGNDGADYFRTYSSFLLNGADRHRSSSPSFFYSFLMLLFIVGSNAPLMRIIEVKCNLARRRPMVGVSYTVKNNCSSSSFSFQHKHL